jgi:thioredoxin reductase
MLLHSLRGRGIGGFMEDVAIVGGGPCGLVAAKYLKQHGLNPVIFERCPVFGGQWSGEPLTSGVWPLMRTNTSHVMTCFSDLPHPPDVCVYPTNQQVRAYLERYARHFDLLPHLRLGTRVSQVTRSPHGPPWTVRYSTNGTSHAQPFSKVIIASGAYNHPVTPVVPGMDTFDGPAGIAHAFAYKAPERYRGLRVLVAGCSISSLEIASDLAMLGAARVVSSNRRQRYIIQKLLGGIPTDHIAFTRFAALCEECLPPDQIAANLKEMIVRTCGSPEQYGAPKPSDSIFQASITQSQAFLPLVAEGRITCKPWISRIQGRRVEFTDGSAEEFDAIIFGTGYALHLPFLGEDISVTWVWTVDTWIFIS